MGLSSIKRLFLSFFSLLLIPSPALAAAALRLSNTVIGPVSIAQGAAGPAQDLEAFNAGDGQLSLTFASSAPWAVPSAQAERDCTTRGGKCIPVRVSLNTQQLTAGIHTARVRVLDSAAVDAPQEILVTVQIGGGVPDRLTFFVAPNGSSDEATITTNAPITTTSSTQAGGNWLSVALEGLGSFRFVLPYKVTARHLPGMNEGTFTGSIDTRSTAFAPDTKSVQISLRVTSQPILTSNTNSLHFRVAQNSIPVTQFLVLSNRGLGTLSITSATGATTSGGEWLTVERVAGTDLISVRASAASVAPGAYQGTVTVATNAVNSPFTVPVTLVVVAQSGPVVSFERVVNNSTFASGETLSQGGISAIFGEQLSYREPAVASSLPLPTELGGARVFVNDQPAPVFFSSYGQINFQIPYSTPPGRALVRVDRDGQRGNAVSVNINPSVPRILRLRGDFAIAVNSDGTFPLPARFGILNVRPARRGEAIVIYAIGLGPTNPSAVTGAASPAAEPLARVASNSSRVLFGAGPFGAGIAADALFNGLTPGFVGLYQINVVIPDNAPQGEVPIQLLLDTASSDIVFITVE